MVVISERKRERARERTQGRGGDNCRHKVHVELGGLGPSWEQGLSSVATRQGMYMGTDVSGLIGFMVRR